MAQVGKLTNDDRNEIVDLYVKYNLSMPQIAAKFNVQVSTISRTLKKLGVVIRKRNDKSYKQNKVNPVIATPSTPSLFKNPLME